MHPLNVKVVGLSTALFGTVTFGLCVLYGLIAPKGLHATQLLEWMLPGFKWLSLGSFLLGVVETFLYGAYLGLSFTVIYNVVLRRST